MMTANASSPSLGRRRAQVNELLPLGDWLRHHSLRSWAVQLFLVLICVPTIALVILGPSPGTSTFEHVAWIFAAYFALAWLLLLGVIVRPQHVSRAMLAAIAVVGVVTQAPTAIFLETKLHAGTSSLLDIFTIGLPEELAKAIPIVVVAWIWRRYWHTQTPRDYLFLGAVSGLVFGAAEVVHYFTDVLGSISGHATGLDLQTLTIQYIWRFLTDPIDHACWAGITGYFIGLAITSPHREYWIGLIGIGIASVLHGLNDWNPINSHPAWVLITLISVLLFLGYARAGAWLPEQAMAAPEGMAVPAGQAQAQPWAAPAPWAAAPPAPPPASPTARPRAPATRDEWWQHVPAAAPPPQPAAAPHAAATPRAATPSNRTAPAAAAPYNPATAPTVVQRKPPVRPWWEQER